MQDLFFYMLPLYNNDGHMSRCDCVIIFEIRLNRIKVKASQCSGFTTIMWGGSGEVYRVIAMCFAVVVCLIYFPPFPPHSLVSIHSPHWLPQCFVDRCLKGGLWLSCHGDPLAAFLCCYFYSTYSLILQLD